MGLHRAGRLHLVRQPACPGRVINRLACGCAAGAGAPEVVAAAAAFHPAAVLGVDWHSVGAYEQLRGALPGTPPFIYLNYRCEYGVAPCTAVILLASLLAGQHARGQPQCNWR